MKFPVFSQLAGNLVSETSSLVTPSSSGESAANLNFGGEARVAGSGPDRRVLRRGLDWLAVLVVYCFGLGGLIFLS